MTRAEAKRSVCHGAAALLGGGHENDWLYTDENGVPLSDADAALRVAALEELIAELSRRGSGGAKKRTPA